MVFWKCTMMYHGLHPGKTTKNPWFYPRSLNSLMIFGSCRVFFSARPPRPVPWDPSAAAPAPAPPGPRATAARPRRRCSAAPRRGGRDEERKKWKHLGFPWDFWWDFGGWWCQNCVSLIPFFWEIENWDISRKSMTFHAWDVKWFHAVFFLNGYLTINL